jgi:RNA polymerase sigma-70 factor (ECF subfamily)
VLTDRPDLVVALPTRRLRSVAPTPRETDSAVIRRSLSDPRSFELVFERHWARLHAYCASRAGDAGEDIAAEAFRVAFDRRRRFDLRHDDAGPWLFGIATNLLREHFRRAERARRAGERLSGDPATEATDDALGRVEAERLGPQLAHALGSLPAPDRDALLLLAWGNLDYEEIARALDVPIGTVRSRIHRARARLQTHLITEELA